MIFSEAYNLLLDGKKIKREAWGNLTYIALHRADKSSSENYIYLSSNDTLRAWTSAQMDIPSEDWVLVEE